MLELINVEAVVVLGHERARDGNEAFEHAEDLLLVLAGMLAHLGVGRVFGDPGEQAE